MTNDSKIADQVVRDLSAKQLDVYCVILDGELLPTEWSSKSAAEAGLIVERERKAARLLKEGKTP